MAYDMQAWRRERFCTNIRIEAEGLVYWVCACGAEVRFARDASRKDRQDCSTRAICPPRIVGEGG